jgi:hypothetical protein
MQNVVIAHFKSGLYFFLLSESCTIINDIDWIHVKNYLYHVFPSLMVKQFHALRSIVFVYPFNSENRDINITYKYISVYVTI